MLPLTELSVCIMHTEHNFIVLRTKIKVITFKVIDEVHPKPIALRFIFKFNRKKRDDQIKWYT